MEILKCLKIGALEGGLETDLLQKPRLPRTRRTMEAEGGRFDLLLTDIKMPVMDGIALALQVGASFPEVTILMMTGFADQRERAHGLEALIYDVIAKPFTLADLLAKVDDALNGVPVEVVPLARRGVQ